MSYVGRERPGVYSNYEASSIIWGNPIGKTVGLVAKSSADAGTLYNITRVSDAYSIFGNNELISKLCETILQNGAVKVAVVSAGSNNYDVGFKKIETLDDICVVVCDSEDKEIHEKLKNSVVSASKNLKERIGIVSYPEDEYTTTLGKYFNCERIIVIAQSPVDLSGNAISSCFLAAALAGILSQTIVPTVSFNGKELNSIMGLTENLTENKVDEYIQAGITPFETVLDQTEVIRAVTSKTTTDDNSDTTFKDVNTILVVDYVILGLRNVLTNLLSGAKNNSSTREAISTQVTIELEKYKSQNIIDGYDQPQITQDKDDLSVCIVEVKFEVSHGMNQIYITANVRV